MGTEEESELESGQRRPHLGEIAKAIMARLWGPNIALPAFRADSREICPGNGFVALPGQRKDGHTFIEEALKKGATAIIARLEEAEKLSDNYPNVTFLGVTDTLEALVGMAKFYLRWARPKEIIAITGSVGKTTTKKLLSQALSVQFKVCASERSHNTLIGCSLAILSMETDADILVLEMGTNAPGEIARLVEAFPPTLGIITEIAPSHLEGLGSLEGVLEAKLELLRSSRLSLLSYNFDNITLRNALKTTSKTLNLLPIGYERGSAWRILSSKVFIGDRGPRLSLLLENGGRTLILESALWERQYSYALAFALAVSYHCGVLAEAAIAAIGEVLPENGRGRTWMGPHGAWIIDESYNANPASMIASIDSASLLPCEGRRWALLGGMKELGGESDFWHRNIAKRLRSFGKALLLGEEWKGAFADEDDHLRPISNIEEGRAILDASLKPGDLLLVKGSRAYGLEEALKGWEERKCRSLAWQS